MPELLIILTVLLLLFGARKVPELARSVGVAMKELKHGMHDDAAAEPVPAVASAAPLPESPG